MNSKKILWTNFSSILFSQYLLEHSILFHIANTIPSQYNEFEFILQLTSNGTFLFQFFQRKIDPRELLECLDSLLGKKGGIKGESEVKRMAE